MSVRPLRWVTWGPEWVWHLHFGHTGQPLCGVLAAFTVKERPLGNEPPFITCKDCGDEIALRLGLEPRPPKDFGTQRFGLWREIDKSSEGAK